MAQHCTAAAAVARDSGFHSYYLYGRCSGEGWQHSAEGERSAAVVDARAFRCSSYRPAHSRDVYTRLFAVQSLAAGGPRR